MTRVDTTHPAYISVQQIVSARRTAREELDTRYREELDRLLSTYHSALLVEVANMKEAGMSNYAVSKALGNTNWGQVMRVVDDATARRKIEKG